MTDDDQVLKVLSHHTGVGQPWLRTYDAHLKGVKLQEATMTDNQTLTDWVQIEAAKRCGWYPEEWGDMCDVYKNDDCFRALCDMILKYEQPPVDRKLLCAEEAYAVVYWDGDGNDGDGMKWVVLACVRAIELFEAGYGK